MCEMYDLGYLTASLAHLEKLALSPRAILRAWSPLLFSHLAALFTPSLLSRIRSEGPPFASWCPERTRRVRRLD